MSLTLTPLAGIPLIQPGVDLVEIFVKALNESSVDLTDDDILVIAQKIVSKAEGQLVNLTQVYPSERAYELAKICEKDPRYVEMVLRESKAVVRCKPGILVVEHKLGFVCANAGIDHSNVLGPWGNPEDWILLLPQNPDESAQNIRKGLEHASGKRLGVLIIDSHGRAWRNGTIGTAIGISGLPGVVDLRGVPDLFGYRLQITQVAVADELASAASLMMGQADECRPAVHVRGFPYSLREANIAEIIRPKEMDLFR